MCDLPKPVSIASVSYAGCTPCKQLLACTFREQIATRITQKVWGDSQAPQSLASFPTPSLVEKEARDDIASTRLESGETLRRRAAYSSHVVDGAGAESPPQTPLRARSRPR